MKRDEILDEAKRLTTGDRQADYGDASESFAKVGIVWEQIIGVPVSATQVALMMSALKIIRATESPAKADNWVDLAGYAALGGEIAGSSDVPFKEKVKEALLKRGGPSSKLCGASNEYVRGGCQRPLDHDGLHSNLEDPATTWR